MSKFSLTAFEKAAREHATTRGSHESRDLYEHDLDEWLAWCSENGCDPAQPTLSAASKFRDELLGNTSTRPAFAPLTVRRKLAELSSMYDAAMGFEEPRASWNPFKTKVVSRPSSSDYEEEELLPAADARKLIAAASAEETVKGLRDATVMEVLYGTGLRISEALILKRVQVRKRAGQVIFANVKVKKGGRRDIEVPDDAAAALDRWLEQAPESEYVFPQLSDTNRSYSRKTFYKRLNDYATAAGVEVHPHSFRAAFATNALDSGAALHEVQAAMGHADPKTTQRYDRRVRGTGVAAAVEKFRRKQSEEE